MAIKMGVAGNYRHGKHIDESLPAADHFHRTSQGAVIIGAHWSLALSIGLLVIAALAIFTYWPMIGHFPNGDHLMYMVDTVWWDDFGELVRNTYSYTRTRVIAPGDVSLFRPLLYVWLAVEKSLFGNRFGLWYAANLGLHLAIVGLLVTLIAGLARTAAASTKRLALPLLLGLFFAVNAKNVPMVAYIPISGYLLFAVFVLLALGFIARWAHAERPPCPETLLLGGAWLFLLAASFTYEAGQVAAIATAVAVGLVAWLRGHRQKAVLLAVAYGSIALLYQIVNRLDMRVHAGRFSVDVSSSDVLLRALNVDTLTNSVRFAVFTFVQAVVPDKTAAIYGEFISLREYTSANSFEVAAEIIGSVTLVALVLNVGVRLWGLRREPRAIPALAVAFVAMVTGGTCAALNILGRMNFRGSFSSNGPTYLSHASWYSYLPLLFGLVALGAILAVSRSRLTNRRRRIVAVTVGSITVFCSLAHVPVSYTMLSVHKQNYSDQRAMNDAGYAFIDQHAHEANFSINVAPDASLAWAHGFPVALLWFHAYLDNRQPAYVLTSLDQSGSHWVAARNARHPPETDPLNPGFLELVLVQPNYVVYRRNGNYCAWLSNNQYIGEMPSYTEINNSARRMADYMIRLQ